MSGIAGIWHLDGQPAASERIRCMTDAIAHRGPDGVGRWVEGSVGLGHVMLRTVPEAEGETQPLVSEDGAVVLVMDGRVDNREEMIRALGLPAAFLRRPDSALVLAGYRRRGADVLKHMLGDYALAVWDAREQRLLLARDHFGIRPLYYVHRPGRFFAFASEVKALRAAGFAGDGVNELKIAEFLLFPVHVEPEMTFFKEVCAVPPAHTLTIEAGGDVRSRAYWALDPMREIRFKTDEDYVAQFQAHFEEAVRCRLRSHAPVGSMLSGGLDSTSIACVAARQLEKKGKPLHTYSAVFDGIPSCNERPFIEAALRKYPDVMQPVFFDADTSGPLVHNAELTWYLERPNEGINTYMSWSLHHRAREQGVRVVLDGFDGDTTVSHGDGYFYELLWSYHWVKLWREVRATVLKMGGRERHARRAFFKWMKQYVRLQPGMARVLAGLGRGEVVERETLRFSTMGTSWAGRAWQRYFAPSFVDAVVPHEAEAGRPEVYRTERARHHAKLTRPIMAYGAQLINAQAAAAGLEVRMPFFDVRLVEYCLALPGHLKRRDGWGRWIMRRAMDGILPPEVQWRNGKTNLAPGYIRSFQEEERETLRQYAVAFAQEGLLADYIDGEAVGHLARQLAGGSLNAPKLEAERMVLWRALALAQWFATVVENKEPEIDPCTVDSI
jgi:asparagine synthase (glutamine-hydrolysing)